MTFNHNLPQPWVRVWNSTNALERDNLSYFLFLHIARLSLKDIHYQEVDFCQHQNKYIKNIFFVGDENSSGELSVLIVYVDDIVVTWND